MREASEEHPRENAPSYKDSGSRSQAMPGSYTWQPGAHAAPLTNEFGQVQVKCSRKKPDVALRSSEWNMGSRSAACSSLSISLSFPFPPSHPPAYPSPTFSLATACDSPLTNGSLCTILTTVHYPRLWFFGPWLPRRAGEMHSREMHRRGGDVLCKTLGGMESRWNRNPRVCPNGTVIVVELRGEKARRRLPRRYKVET